MANPRSKEFTITFKDKYYLLLSIASKFTVRSGGRYEVHELVNEAWLSRYVRDATETQIFWMAGYWAMVDYMHKQQHDGQKQNHIKTFSLYNKDGRYVYEPEIKATCPLDVQDDLRYMLQSKLTQQERDVIAMSLEGQTFKSIGSKLGLCRERIRQVKNKAFAKMRIRYQISMGERK